MKRNLCKLSIAALFLGVGLFCAFADASDGVVTGTGHVTVKRTPQILRAQFTLSADGKDITEAIANLKAAQAAATKKLAELEATQSSIEFGAMQIPGSTGDARQQLQRMMMMQQRGQKKPAAGPPVVSLTCTLKGEWPLKEGTPEELLAAGYTLQEKIKGSGLGKPTKKLSPEEQEAMEEAIGMNGGAANSDEPVFVYVSKVSEADRAAAMAEAFKKAKADAATTAKAADSQLGTLQKTTNSIAGAAAGPTDMQEVYLRFVMQQAGAAAPASEDTHTDEATGSTPGPVELHVTATATFDLAK